MEQIKSAVPEHKVAVAFLHPVDVTLKLRKQSKHREAEGAASDPSGDRIFEHRQNPIECRPAGAPLAA